MVTLFLSIHPSIHPTSPISVTQHIFMVGHPCMLYQLISSSSECLTFHRQYRPHLPLPSAHHLSPLCLYVSILSSSLPSLSPLLSSPLVSPRARRGVTGDWRR